MATSTINTIVEVESLGTGATIFRIGKMRILQLSDYQGANYNLHVDVGDAPTSDVSSVAIVRGSTGLSNRIGQITIRSASPYYVNRYPIPTYNAAGEGAMEVSATDKTSGTVVWTV